MNAVIENIKTRRSVRSYKEELPKKADLDAIIDAGLYAPTTKGEQARHLLVIKGIDKVNELNDILKRATASAGKPDEQIYRERVLQDNYHISYGAPVFVLVTAPKTGITFADADGAIILQTMFLAAHSLGIGSVWINQLRPVADVPVMREFISKHGVPADYKIVGGAAFGYASNPPANVATRKNTVSIYE
ncbi:nitroreductase [Deferribacterales bacterium RsTz2092]|nr:NAD(P)H nitroreductase [Deferribacterales bacterium]